MLWLNVTHWRPFIVKSYRKTGNILFSEAMMITANVTAHLKSSVWGCCCGWASESSTCVFSSSYGCQFKSWPLHFLSSFLLMCLGKQWRMMQVFRPCTHVQTQKMLLAPSFRLVQLWYSYLWSKPVEEENKWINKSQNNPSVWGQYCSIGG